MGAREGGDLGLAGLQPSVDRQDVEDLETGAPEGSLRGSFKGSSKGSETGFERIL